MAEYSICKCIRTDKPLKRNGKYPIYLRVRVGFRDTKIPTNLDTFPDQWDKRKNEPRNKALLIQLNKKVLDLDLHINRCLADGQDLTLNLIRDFYSGKRKVKPEFGSFYDYYLDFVERKRKEGINPETIRVYMTTYNVMKEFRKEFRICDVSLSLIEKFDDHMRDINGNSSGGRNPKHKNLRTVILDIQKHNIAIDNPYRFFKIPNLEVKEIYLDKSELNTLMEYTEHFAPTSKEYQILKMYQFSCFCGLRFSDAMDLEWRQIDFKNNLIRKVMIKTKTEVITPLFPMACEILLEKIRNKAINESDKVFYQFSEPTVNQTLRKQTRLAGIDKHITYHSSRHTFATLSLALGIDLYTVCKLLGHKNIISTQVYAKIIDASKRQAIDRFNGVLDA